VLKGFLTAALAGLGAGRTFCGTQSVNKHATSAPGEQEHREDAVLATSRGLKNLTITHNQHRRQREKHLVASPVEAQWNQLVTDSNWSDDLCGILPVVETY
jgi:hypothetical protein